MRRAVTLALALVLGLAACAGPRLVSSARLPGPVVHRVEGPPLRTEGESWPVRPAVETFCVT